MKPGVSITLAAIALFGLIGIQYFLISDLYDLKKNEFDTMYGTSIKNGLIDMQTRLQTNGLDTVFYLMDLQAIELLSDYAFADDDSIIQQLNSYVIEKYQEVLYNEEKISIYLKNYLEEFNLDTDFRSGFLVYGVSIVDQDSVYLVYSEEEDQAFERRAMVDETGAIHVNRFQVEGNYFRIDFDYFIDFTHKTRIILRDMTIAFILALLSILVAGAVFLVTIRNMLKHKKLSEMKTDFINNLAHELKTPLTTVSVASSTLADSKIQMDKDRITSLSDLIRQQNKQLTQLIDRILDINIWEKDQITLKKQDVMILELIKNRLNAFRLENINKKVNVIEDLKLVDKMVNIDEFQFTIALNNILSNALKYGGDPPEIKVEAGIINETLYISVVDNGPGIDREEQRNIFAKFYRGNRNRKNIKGLGLGLFYVRKIIEMHGGTVELNSKPGKGSEFTIILPIETD